MCGASRGLTEPENITLPTLPRQSRPKFSGGDFDGSLCGPDKIWRIKRSFSTRSIRGSARMGAASRRSARSGGAWPINSIFFGIIRNCPPTPLSAACGGALRLQARSATRIPIPARHHHFLCFNREKKLGERMGWLGPEGRDARRGALKPPGCSSLPQGVDGRPHAGVYPAVEIGVEVRYDRSVCCE